MELRIIVWHFSFLLCTEIFQITKVVSVKVVKSVHDHYKSKSDEKSCVVIEGGARSTRPVHIALVSVNIGCSRKLVAVAFSCIMSLLIYLSVLYSLRVQGLLFLLRLPMSCTIPSEMFRRMHYCKLWKGGKEWLGIMGFDRTERHLADSSTSRRSVITPRTSSNCL